jgi:hypothetical protein
MWKRVWPLAAAFFWLVASLPDANAQGTRADYDRAAQLSALTRGKVFKSVVRPRWLGDQQRLWYRNELGNGAREFVLVDAVAGERRLAFDHSRLAKALSSALQEEISAQRLPFDEIAFDDPLTTVRFTVNGRRWECLLASYELREVGPGDAAVESLPMLDEPHPSRRTGEETSLRFINRTKETIQVFWLDTEGRRKAYATLKPDEEHEQHTFAGHVWLVTANGKTLGIFEATETAGRAIIDGARKPKRNQRHLWGVEPRR